MGQLILYMDGAYNLYTMIGDSACYESALTLDQLQMVIRLESGEQGLRDLPSRLERAHRTGCSSAFGVALEDCVATNRAGPQEACMPFDEFVTKYLTLPPRE